MYFVNNTVNTFKVLLGEHKYTDDSETTHIRANIDKIVDHPDYNHRTTDNDYSMLRLKNAVDFAAYPHIRPICLPTDTSEVRWDFTHRFPMCTV